MNTTSPTHAGALLIGPGGMLLTAGLFGYFGFMMGFPEVDTTTGKLIPMVVTLKWTLRVAAIAFLVAAGLVMAAPAFGNLLYATIGLLAAVAFVAIAVWDVADKRYVSGVHPFLLIVFALWNGYSSVAGLRQLLSGRPASEPHAAPREPGR